MRAVISNGKAPLPLEGRGRGWGAINESLHHPLPDPPLKGEGGQEPQRREEDAP